LKRKRKSEDEFLAAARASDPTPDYTNLEYPHIETPPTNTHFSSHQTDASPLASATPSWTTTTHSGSLSHQATRLPTPVSFPSTPHEQRSSFDFSSQRDPTALDLQASLERCNFSHQPKLPFSQYPQLDTSATLAGLPEGAAASTIWSQLDSMESFKSVINQLLRPDSPAGCASAQLNMFKILSGSQPVSSQDELIRGLSRQRQVANHEVDYTTDYHDGTDLPQNFLVHFFGAFMLHRQGFSEAAADSFRHAKGPLQSMIRDCHPECLTTLNVMLSVLEAHGQNEPAGEFLSYVLVFSQRNLNNNPVAATAEFMVNVATRQLKIDDVEIASLASIHHQLEDQFGVRSPSALVGLYHVAWRCAKAGQHREKALQTLTKLVPLAAEILGPSHFLTITCMTTMARVLSYIRSVEAAIRLMHQALGAIDSRYAEFHPYRLEVLYRLGRLQIHAHNAKDAGRILEEVVEHRVKVLGIDNKLTQHSLELLREARASGEVNAELHEAASGLLPEKVREIHEHVPWTAYLPIAATRQAVGVIAQTLSRHLPFLGS
jgi:hypothetical protein